MIETLFRCFVTPISRAFSFLLRHPSASPWPWLESICPGSRRSTPPSLLCWRPDLQSPGGRLGHGHQIQGRRDDKHGGTIMFEHEIWKKWTLQKQTNENMAIESANQTLELLRCLAFHVNGSLADGDTLSSWLDFKPSSTQGLGNPL